jgi:hypothetical protein
MVVSNQRLNPRVCCLSFFIGLLCAGAAFAPPLEPPPPALEQPFAAVFFADQDAPELILEQDHMTYEGCVQLKVVHNIPLVITARVTPTLDIDLPNVWMIKLNEPGEKQKYAIGTTTNDISQLHQPGAPGDLQLCVRVRGVNPEWHAAHKGMTNVTVARVTLTVMPRI